jgi:CHAD domain-containing protein
MTALDMANVPRSIAEVRSELDPLADLESVATIDLLRRTMARSTVRLVAQVPVVELGEDPEGIHDARVAARRLRSDLRTFGPVLDPAWAKPLRAELGWVGALLGRVRDAEVLIARLGARIESIADPGITAGKLLLDDLELQRTGARRRLLEGLRSERFGNLIDRLGDGASAPRSVDGGTADAADTAGTLMSRPWRRLVRAAGRPGPQPEDADLHRVRIEVKRVRYAAEAFSPALGTRADRFAAAARNLQDLLGEHHDAVVSLAWLTANGIGADDTSVAFAAGRLAEYESMERDRRRDAWPKAWARLEKRKRFWT